MPAGPPWEPKREPKEDPLISLITIKPEEYPLRFDGLSRVAMAWTHIAAPKKGGYEHLALFKVKRRRVVDFLMRRELEVAELRMLSRALNALEEQEQKLWDCFQELFSQQTVRYRLVEKSIFNPIPRKGAGMPEVQGYALADIDFTTEEILQLHELDPNIAIRMAQFQAIKNREAKDAPIVEGEHPLSRCCKETQATARVNIPRQSLGL